MFDFLSYPHHKPIMEIVDKILLLNRFMLSCDARDDNLCRYKEGCSVALWNEISEVDQQLFDEDAFYEIDTTVPLKSNQWLTHMDCSNEWDVDVLRDQICGDSYDCSEEVTRLLPRADLLGRVLLYKLVFEHRSTGEGLHSWIYHTITERVTLPKEYNGGEILWRSIASDTPPVADLQHDIAMCDTLATLMRL